MAQHDYSIANQGFPATRADINNVLSAIATNNSGTSAPSSQYAGQFWIDTTSTTWTLYIHDGSDDIEFATIDTSANTVNFRDSTLAIATDPSPQLGADLDVNGNQIVSVSNGDIIIAPNGTGKVDINGNLDVDGGTIKLDGSYPVGTNNTALGDQALDDASLTGGCNTAIGKTALTANTTGNCNVALGLQSLFSNTTASCNTAIGTNSILTNTTGANNTAIGFSSLRANTTASNNTAVGRCSLYANTTAGANTALGDSSLSSNTTGASNVASGYASLNANTTGCFNTALGRSALANNSTGCCNISVGSFSLSNNTTGSFNTALGRSAGSTANGTNLTMIGFNAQPSSAGASNEITLGDANITVLRCNDTSINSLSDERDKTDIVDSPFGLDLIELIQPRQFRWQSRDGNGKDGQTHIGFIAQELQSAVGENNNKLRLVMDSNPEKLEVAQGNLVPVLVQAIKELKSQNEDLKSRIEALET